ncbi:murein transglycosylase A [Neptunomonas japonica]|uniref:Membrane-bound lytic murein transglycosylase A n=1 Tax=Neptunomonas japonica JAMM 1380 TaxID=1441457 RepID=A0A7R6PTD2_9GAMM|nr:MltA domain-containing protein [Neptunomonas japonica]BBB30080.1 membrane-bound lytic murein transglycosylase A [Neptunomonas japonica JAMM 1380]
MLTHATRCLLSPRTITTSCIALLLHGCSSITPPPPGVNHATCWNKLHGWQQDSFSEALPALLSQCPRLSKKSPEWKNICSSAKSLTLASDVEVRRFIEENFIPHTIIGTAGKNEGLITGYYEPTLNGSLKPDDQYSYPLYQTPKDMLTVKLDSRFKELKGKRVRGRITGNTVIPYYSRAEIDKPESPLKGQELLWVDDPDAAFFLHIQGSGRIQLTDGSMVGVGYANQNGHPYVAIGKKLIETGALTREEVSLDTIRQWLDTNPSKAQALKNQNPSYVFFTMRHDLEFGPRGSLNVPLTPERSVAVDRKIIPLGTPLWVTTTLPGTNKPYQRLVFAQDTGGAINGPVRADVFFGRGERAEKLAGEMKQKGSIYALLPKPANSQNQMNCQ